MGDEQSRESATRRRVDPLTLRSQLKGDLDWIVMRALEKDRTRRYASPSELAADVGRYLRNEPVEASPPSALYRLRKFARCRLANKRSETLRLVHGGEQLY